MRIRVTVLRQGLPVDGQDVLLDAPGGATATSVLPQLPGEAGELWLGDRPSESLVLGEPPLVDGAVLAPRPLPPVPDTWAGPRLRVLSGPDAGASHRLARGRCSIGRAPTCSVVVRDAAASRLHAELEVDDGGVQVRDLGSANGTALDGEPAGTGRPARAGARIEVGETVLELAGSPTGPRAVVVPDGRGGLRVHRAPRLRAPTTTTPVSVPSPPVARELPRFPVLVVLLPLALAGVLLFTTRESTTWLLVLLLSPLMAVANAVGERLSGRRAGRRARAAHRAELDRARVDLADACRAEVARRRDEHPDPATVLELAEGRDARLWERRPGDDDALVVRLGTADLTAPELLAAGPPGPSSEPALSAVLPDAPVVLPLADTGVLGLAGPRAPVLALARALVGGVLVAQPPDEVSLVVVAGAATGEDWAWSRWPEHTRPLPGSDCARSLSADESQASARVAELDALITARRLQRVRSGPPDASGATGPAVVVLVDRLREDPGLPALARVLAEGPAVGVVAVCLAETTERLPESCSSVVEVQDGGHPTFVLRRSGAHGPVRGRADQAGRRWAQRLARALAPLRAAGGGGDGRVPNEVDLLDVLGLPDPSPDSLAAHWRTTSGSTDVVVGIGPGGPARLDLQGDGPHLLVAGTTGSGKSEFLRTLVASLAAANRPDALGFVLVDYKGGSAFRECARLPHSLGLVTDLDGHLTGRALRSLGAELRRRERLMAAAGVAGFDEYQRAGGARDRPLPRLVIVVDEFATLVEELPAFVDGLVSLARRGRSLGLHLVLATQRPAGVVTPEIRANTALRVALRVTDAQESLDVVDVPDAASIPRSTPGRCWVRSSGGAVAELQVARAGSRRTATAPTARPLHWRELGDPVSRAAEDGPVSDLALLVAALREAADLEGVAAVPAPWLPPLPHHLHVDDLAEAAGPGSGADEPERVPLGLLDLPDDQARGVFALDLAAGEHLVVVGGPGSGRTSAVRTLAAGVARGRSADQVHLYAFDGGGGLADLAELPHCGAVVRGDEVRRGVRLLDRLAGEVARRRTRPGTGGQDGSAAAEPRVVLAVDGWEQFADAYERVEHGRPLETLAALLRDGPAVGLTVVLTGGRSLLTHRVAGQVTHRLVLRLPDPTDAALAGLPLTALPRELPRGRGLLAPCAVEVQLADLGGDPAAVLAQLGAAAAPPSTYRPLRVVPLPAAVDLDELAAAAPTSPLWLPLGRGGDEAVPLGLDLAAGAPGCLVVGGRGSGRTGLLAAVGAAVRRRGTAVVAVAPERSRLAALLQHGGGALDESVVRITPARHEELARAVDGAAGPLLVLVDDVEALADTPAEQVLLQVLREARDGTPRGLVAAGLLDAVTATYRGLPVELRRGRTGVLLGPRSPVDGDVLGVATGALEPPRPGRGLLVVDGRATPLQAVSLNERAPAGQGDVLAA